MHDHYDYPGPYYLFFEYIKSYSERWVVLYERRKEGWREGMSKKKERKKGTKRKGRVEEGR